MSSTRSPTWPARRVSDSPISPVTISSASITPNTTNAVLLVSADSTATGPANVTVTASDASNPGSSTSTGITINVNQPPVLAQPADVTLAAGTTATFQLQATGSANDPLTYGAAAETADVTVDCNSQTGVVTVTPNPGVAGVRIIDVGVQDPYYTWQVDQVPVLISPLAPTAVTFDAPAGTSGGLTISTIRRRTRS